MPLRAVHVTGCVRLDARVLARLQQRRQEGVLAVEPHQDQQVRPVQERHEARFHRHPVRVFDTGGEAVHIDLVAADVARQVRQVGERGDDPDFGGKSGHGAQANSPSEQHDREQTERFRYSWLYFSFQDLALLPAVRVRADDPCPLQIDRMVRAQAGGGG